MSPGATVVRRAILLGLVALAARALVVAVAGRHFDVASPGDHVSYSAFARLMMSGPHWFSYPLADREPLYPLLMAIAYAFPGGDFGTLQIFQILLGGAAAVGLYLGFRPYMDERIALLSGWMFALHPHYVPIVAEPLRENLIVPLVIVWVVTFFACMRRPTRTRLFLHAAAIVLLAHTDVRFLPLAVMFPVMAWIHHRGLARAARETAWVAGFTVVLMIPYQVRGYVAMGHPVIVTERFFGRWLPRVGTVSEVAPKVAKARRQWLADWEARKQAALDTLSVADREFFEAGNRPLIGQAAVHWFLFKEYWRFLRRAPVYRPYPDGRYAPAWSFRHDLASSLVMIPFLVLLPVLLVVAGRSERRVILPLLAYLAAHCLLHVVVHSRERYRIPLEVITDLVVAMAVVLIWDIVNGRRGRNVALPEGRQHS